MIDGACIRSINHFQDIQTEGFILESNSWKESSNAINLLGNDRKNNKEKGDAFELLNTLYIASDPIFASKLSNLWHHSNVRYQIFDALVQFISYEYGMNLKIPVTELEED